MSDLEDRRQILRRVFSGRDGEEAALTAAEVGHLFLHQTIDNEEQRIRHNTMKMWLVECGFQIRLEQTREPAGEGEEGSWNQL